MGIVDYIQNDLVLDPKEQLKKSVRRRIIIGAVMTAMLPLLPIVVFLIQYSVSDFVIMLIFVIFGIGGIGGLLLAAYYGVGSSMLMHSFDILKELSPPDPMIVDRVLILNRAPVYLVGQWGSNTIYLVAFHQAERSFDSKLKLPRVFWAWEYKHQIGDIKVARREGAFTIPVEDGVYLSGPGIIYSLMVERGHTVRIRLDYTAEQLNQIIDRLTNDIQSDESGF